MTLDLTFRLDGHGSCERLLVLLHGYGATQNDIATIGSQIDPDGRYFMLCPRGPIKVPGGGASWYDFDDTWRADPKSFTETLDALDALVNAACTRLGLQSASVVMGGFSQGAGMAAWLAYSTPEASRPAGFWCCGTLVDVDDTPLDLSAARDTRALVLAGRDDPNVPLKRNRTQAQRLQAAGADVTFSEHDGGHGLSPAMLTDMARWLNGFS